MYGLCSTILSAVLAVHPADLDRARRHDARPALTSLPHGNELSLGKAHQIDRDAGSIVLGDDVRDAQTPRKTMRLFAIHPSMLDRISAGDRVEFRAEDRNGTFILTHVRPWCAQ